METNDFKEYLEKQPSNYSTYTKFLDTNNGYLNTQMIASFLNFKSPTYNYYPEKLETLNKLFEGTDEKFDNLKNINLKELLNKIIDKVVKPTDDLDISNKENWKPYLSPGQTKVMEVFKKPIRALQNNSLEYTNKLKESLKEMSKEQIIAKFKNEDGKLNSFGINLIKDEMQSRIYSSKTDDEILSEIKEKGLGSNSLLDPNTLVHLTKEITRRCESIMVNLGPSDVNANLNEFEIKRLSDPVLVSSTINAKKNENTISEGFLKVALAKNFNKTTEALKWILPADVAHDLHQTENIFLRNIINDNLIQKIVEHINAQPNLVADFKTTTGMLPVKAKEENISEQKNTTENKLKR